MSRTCYMCDSKANSVEHIPPKCLFPRKKDLPRGVDLRKQLITVPSCYEHNSKKSKDDEYLLYCLVMSIPSNEVGKNIFVKKIMRAIQRNPSLIKQFLSNHRDVFVQNIKTLKIDKSLGIEIDIQRIENEIEHLSRALFFDHFGEKWLGEVSIYPNFLLSMADGYRKTNQLIKDMDDMAEELFSKEKLYGDNPEVFKYNAVDKGKDKPKFMRLYFYNGNRITVIFGAKN